MHKYNDYHTMTITLTAGQPYPPLAAPLPGSCYAFVSASGNVGSPWTIQQITSIIVVIVVIGTVGVGFGFLLLILGKKNRKKLKRSLHL